MRLFSKCKHDWKIIQEVTTKSRAELQGECTGKISQHINDYSQKQLHGSKSITIVKCDLCGELKRFVEEV